MITDTTKFNRFMGYSELHYQRIEVAAGIEAFFNWAGVKPKPRPKVRKKVAK